MSLSALISWSTYSCVVCSCLLEPLCRLRLPRRSSRPPGSHPNPLHTTSWLSPPRKALHPRLHLAAAATWTPAHCIRSVVQSGMHRAVAAARVLRSQAPIRRQALRHGACCTRRPVAARTTVPPRTLLRALRCYQAPSLCACGVLLGSRPRFSHRRSVWTPRGGEHQPVAAGVRPLRRLQLTGRIARCWGQQQPQTVTRELLLRCARAAR